MSLFHMTEFKFGQLLTKDDICDRKEEVKRLNKIATSGGRAVVYGPRRYGKTSVVKNIVLADFVEKNKKSLAVYVDLFQLDSLEDFSQRLQTAFEQALSQQAKIRSFLTTIQNYIRHFRVELSSDPITGAPSISLAGQHQRHEKSFPELLAILKEFSGEYKTLLVMDEFQDVVRVSGLEARLRSALQDLNKTGIIVLGSKRHILQKIFQDEQRPFYGFGVDVEFKKISPTLWGPYLQERFAHFKLQIDERGVAEICRLMGDVPNSIQEMCHWITLEEVNGLITIEMIHACLKNLIQNKASRYLERMAFFSIKEKKVLIAVAKMEPVSAITSTQFLQTTRVSATATRATITRLNDYGVLDFSEAGYSLTDPLFKHFLVYQY